MKPELAVLPMDVWADVFVYPWIIRQQLAQIVHRFKERAFADKLQAFLHDPKCGKHSLRSLCITCEHYFPKYQLGKRKILPQNQASLGVAASAWSSYNDVEFPESEMPENITNFKRLSIGHLDDEVLAFLDKIKPLFTDVFLNMLYLSTSAKGVRIFFGRFLPMLGSIRRIFCCNDVIQLFEQHFPGTLALTKELFLFDNAKTAFIPAYLRWLNAPLDFGLHGPRFLKAFAESETIFAIVDAVRQQFLAVTTASTFIIFLQFIYSERHIRVEEFNIHNAATNEQLSVRNAIFERPEGRDINYVEIKRHLKDEDAIMREWIEGRAYYEKKRCYNHDIEVEADMDVGKQIWIDHPSIGHITKKGGEMDQDYDGSDDDDDQDEAGPSTSAKRMKK